MGEAQTSPPRFRLYDALLAGARDTGQSEAFFTGFAARMRFSVGQGVGLPRVPFAIGTDVTAAARGALHDLVGLVRKRADDYSASFDIRHIEALPRSFGMRRIPDSVPERRVIAAIAATDPLLDAGFLESWLLRGGRGGELLRALAATYGKSLDEEARGGFREPTAWATHLALAGHLVQQKDLFLKSETIRGVPYESLERVAGLALSAVVALAIDEKVTAMSSSGILPGNHATAVLLRAGCSPFTTVAIRQAILRQTPNPYRLPREIAEAFDALGVDPLAPGVPAERKAEAAEKAAGRDKALRAACADAWGMNELRAAVVGYLRRWESGPEPRHDAIVAATFTMPGLAACLKDPDRFDAAGRAIASLTSEATGERREDANDVRVAFERASRRDVDAGLAVRRCAQAWLLWRLDRWIEEKSDTARASLVDRAKEFGVGDLKAQWQAGKVYRFAPDEQAILCEKKKSEDAHFFLDLKGFTKMVTRAKEVSTAEFLKHEFYSPILARARGFRDAGRKVELNNLLGDAVSFSGDVVSMLFLAEEVNELFLRHEQGLRARGVALDERVEAGLFITYGASAEVITIDDPVWSEAGITEYSAATHGHRVKVAIAEKINESARGTARNGAVWARMQALLADRRESGKAGVAYELPWRVYVDKSLQMKLPPRVMELVEQAINARTGDLTAVATRVVSETLTSVLGRIVEEGNDGSVFTQAADLYNVGRALSLEALDAFLRATANQRLVARQELAVKELPAEFERFVFPESSLRLVVSWDTGKAARRPMLFRFAGELTFRGFEGMHTTEIYEIVDGSSAVYEAFEKHFFHKWKPAPQVAAG